MKHPFLAFASLALALGSARAAPVGAMPVYSELPSPLDIRGAIGFALDHNYAISASLKSSCFRLNATCPTCWPFTSRGWKRLWAIQ